MRQIENHQQLSTKRIRHLEKLKTSILPSIKNIKVRIHRIRLTGHYTFRDLEELGNLKVNDQYRPSDRMKHFEKHAFLRFRDRKLTVILHPDVGYLPQCIIEMSYPREKLLLALNKKLAWLNVSYAEYTIDLFFNNSDDVKKYFRLLYRYVYFPYQKVFTLHSDKKLSDSTRDTNAWVFTKRMKLYERGPDKKKKINGGWLLNGVDRIRIEFKASWKDLRKHGLTSLEMFSMDPKFELMLKNKFSFKRFKKSSTNNLPSEYEKYTAKDSKGHSGSFQNQYLLAMEKGNIENMSQSIEDVYELMLLRDQIYHKIKERNKKWESRYEELYNVEIAKYRKRHTIWRTISIAEYEREMGTMFLKYKK